MIGQTISHYKILEKLGGGGMGVVYKAEDTKLKRTVALKFLPPVFSFDQEAKERFVNEAQAASSLQHNNICNIHDIDETKDGQIFICMDCYEGETLKKKIERGQIKTDEAIDIIVQVATGLQKAHEKGIIHRDIKPANIFITNDGIVKILDFGLAKLSGQTMMTKMGETVGTIAYMSPEQTRGELVDQRTDIWSLGVVLYEMLTRNLPFKGDYDSAMIYSILNEEPKHLIDLQTDVPKEFQPIIDKCLSKNPSERYQSIDELLDDLKKKKLIEGSGTTTRTIARKKKSRKIIYSVSGIIILAALIIASWMFLKQSPDKSEKSKFIAVLPFHPITSSEEDKNFAEGIHDDILTQLAKIKELRVIARTSVMHYQNTQKTIKEIANELGVGVVLEGSTRRSGDMIRITAQLIDAETEEHLWAESYDRPYTDIFNIQSDVAQKIASALQIKLAKEEIASIQTIPTDNMEAWEYFQKGKYFWYNYFDLEGNLKSAQMFEKACELDTNFAIAYAWQARVYPTVFALTNQDIYLNKYENAIDKTMTLAPDIPEINIARVDYFTYVKGDIDAALKEAEIANTKRPNGVDILTSLATSKWQKGDNENALKLVEQAYTLDPKGIELAHRGWNIAFYADKFSKAEQWADIVIANNPEHSLGYVDKLQIIIDVYGDLKRAEEILNTANRIVTMEKFRLEGYNYSIHFYKRDYTKAIIQNEKTGATWLRVYNKACLLMLLNKEEETKAYFDSLRIECFDFFKNHSTEDGPMHRICLAIAYAGLGDKLKALNEIVKVDSNFQENAFTDVTYFYILLGDKENAIKILERVATKPLSLMVPGRIKLDPRLDPLRSNPRFKKIIAVAEERIRKNEQ